MFSWVFFPLLGIFKLKLHPSIIAKLGGGIKLFQETAAVIAHLVTPQNTCTQNDQSEVYVLPGAAQRAWC